MSLAYSFSSGSHIEIETPVSPALPHLPILQSTAGESGVLAITKTTAYAHGYISHSHSQLSTIAPQRLPILQSTVNEGIVSAMPLTDAYDHGLIGQSNTIVDAFFAFRSFFSPLT